MVQFITKELVNIILIIFFIFYTDMIRYFQPILLYYNINSHIYLCFIVFYLTYEFLNFGKISGEINRYFRFLIKEN